MSEIKVDTVAEKTSANGVTVDGLNIKDSKLVTANSVIETNLTDNIVTLAKMASGTDGNIISYDASGNPVAIATGSDGQVLTSTGAGSPPAFETLPGGGIENITTFRLSTNFTMGTGADITTNWGVTGGAQLGTAISESSGIFTFPQTGYYMIESQLFLQRIQGDSDYIGIEIKATTNNSSYATIFQNYTFIPNTANIHHYVYGSAIFDVTDVSNYKVKLAYQSESATNIRVVGNTSMDRTYIRFIRLGDT